jgi:hypothetical protein
MPRSPAPARTRRKAPDKAPAAQAAAPRRKALTSPAVALAPPVANVADGSLQAPRARGRAKAPAPTAGKPTPRAATVTGKTGAKPALRKKAVASNAPQPAINSVAAGAAQPVVAGTPAPRRGRRRESTAEVLDALDQGFVPKAPPPTARVNAKPGEMPLHEQQSAAIEANPLGGRMSSSAPTRLQAVEPASQSRHDPPAAATATAPPAPTDAVPMRLRCPGCDYPLARQARFCRRCGVAQRPNGAVPLVSEQRPTPAEAPWAQSVPRQAAESEQTDVESKSKHVEIKSLQINGGSKRFDAELLSIEGESPRVAVSSQQLVVASPAAETAVPRLACVACGMPLVGSARFCRSCDGGEDDLQPAPSIQAATPVQVESKAGHHSTPAVATSIRCHACGESLPGIARFCMFCAVPQAVERALAPQLSLPDTSLARLEAAVERHSKPGDSPASHDELSQGDSVSTYAVEAVPVEAVPVEAVPVDAESSETASLQPSSDASPSDIPQPAPPSNEPAPPQAAEASAPPPTAEPTTPAATITLLEPDVVERLARAREAIDEIGRSIDGLARTLTAHSATAKRPSALPPRRR